MKKGQKRGRMMAGTVDILAAALALATFSGFLGRYSWFLDLFSHFRVQYLQICLVLLFITLWMRHYRRAGLLLLLACINYAPVLPLYFGQPEPPDRPVYRAMLINLNASNGNHDAVLEEIRSADPDLLLFLEVTPDWSRQLRPLEIAYKYAVAEPQEGCFGIMLLSRHPLNRERIVEIGASGVPSIQAEVYLPSTTISLIGTHPVPPIGRTRSLARNRQLAELPSRVRQQNHPVLLIGDLNTSPWSPHFSTLIRESGLQNSMQGFGFQPTWPDGVPFMRIPLDHLLHAPEITVHNRIIGRSNGSDHRPVIIDFSVD